MISLCSSTIRRKIHPVLNLTADNESKMAKIKQEQISPCIQSYHIIVNNEPIHCTLLYWVNSLYHFTH